MQSQGSTSSQPSFDSLSSSDSLLFSDSEQAEEDTDVFLTDTSSSVIIGRTGGAMTDGEGGSESPGSQWTCDGFAEKEDEEESYRSKSSSKACLIGLDKQEPTNQSPKSQGDLLFAQKCAELQGYIRPLLELLNGLKKGRFDRGLSSFQQSVAMDRIQRIVGVLQRPNSGEKYLSTLLQVEAMLKLWFPQITTYPVSAASSVATSPARSLHDTTSSTPPHKHRDQSHIPVKKRRLSWTGTESPTPSPVLLKSPRVSTEEEKNLGDSHPLSAALETNQKSPNMAAEDPNEQSKPSKFKSHCSEPSLTWVYVAPIPSPRKSSSSTVGGKREIQPLTTGSSCNHTSPATQDSSVSSTTSKNKKNATKPAWCQSQPNAGQLTDSDRGTLQGQSPPLKSGLCPEHVMSP